MTTLWKLATQLQSVWLRKEEWSRSESSAQHCSTSPPDVCDCRASSSVWTCERITAPCLHWARTGNLKNTNMMIFPEEAQVWGAQRAFPPWGWGELGSTRRSAVTCMITPALGSFSWAVTGPKEKAHRTLYAIKTTFWCINIFIKLWCKKYLPFQSSQLCCMEVRCGVQSQWHNIRQTSYRSHMENSIERSEKFQRKLQGKHVEENQADFHWQWTALKFWICLQTQIHCI